MEMPGEGLVVCRFILSAAAAATLHQHRLANDTRTAHSSELGTQSWFDDTPKPTRSPPVRNPDGTSYDWFEIIIPIICVLGVVGNIFNVIVMTRRRMLSSLDGLGLSAYHGLVALAVSDMFFCLSVFPHAFVPHVMVRGSLHGRLFGMYYKIYGISLINLFMMTSTWLVVATSVTRYRAILKPLQARAGTFTNTTPVVVAAIFVVSLVFTLPYFLHVGVRPCWTPHETAYEFYRPFPSYTTHLLMKYLRWAWPVVASFIPIAILVFCNVNLIRELRSAATMRRRQCPGQVVQGISKRITVTLVGVVLMQLLLVTPSEVLKYVNPYRSWGRVGFVVASVTNTMQALNFASNFLLYLVVNVNFRQTMKCIVLEKWRCRGAKAFRLPADSQSNCASTTYVSLRRLLEVSPSDSGSNKM